MINCKIFKKAEQRWNLCNPSNIKVIKIKGNKSNIYFYDSKGKKFLKIEISEF